MEHFHPFRAPNIWICVTFCVCSVVVTSRATPIRQLPNLQTITFWEVTGGVNPHTFGVSNSSMTARRADPLGSTNYDFYGVSGMEFYDVFYSDADGSFNNVDGEYVTVEAVWPQSSGGGGLNIAEVTLDYVGGTKEYASFVASYVALGNNSVPASVTYAVDGNLNTCTTMGNTVGQSQRLRITLGFRSTHTYPHSDTILGPADQNPLAGFANDPVNTGTGNFSHEEQDFAVASRGLPLLFERFYSSLNTNVSYVGKGWTHNFSSRLEQTAAGTNLVKICWGSARADYWCMTGSVYRAENPGNRSRLTRNGDGTWTCVEKNLKRTRFLSDGRLAKIEDRNGNALFMVYDSVNTNLLKSVTNVLAQGLIFSYDTSNRLTSVQEQLNTPGWTDRSISLSYSNNLLIQVTDVLGNPIRYFYDTNGFLNTIQDQRGITTLSNVCDSAGRVLRQYDGNGNRVDFQYGTPTTNETTLTQYLVTGGVTNAVQTVHGHNGLFQLTQVQYPNDEAVSFDYDGGDNRSGITDRNGNSREFAYDSNGNITNILSPDGGMTDLEYNSLNLPILSVDALGYETEMDYDTNGNLLTETRWLDTYLSAFVKRTWSYNEFGQIASATDERGFTTFYYYNTKGLLAETIDPATNHTWFAYDAAGRLAAATDARGSGAGDPAFTTTYEYDLADRIIAIHTPIGSVTNQYDQVGNLLRTINARGFATDYTYDNNGNRTAVQRPLGNATTYEYDTLNRLVTTTRSNTPTAQLTRRYYDSLGNLTDLEQVVAGGTNLHSLFNYDAQGNVLTSIDPSGVIINNQYDEMNRRTAVINALGGQTLYDYDQRGQLVFKTDARDNFIQYEYDARGLLTTVYETPPDGGMTQYFYDDSGNLTNIVNARGISILRRSYDCLNRVVREEDADGRAWHYAYDPVGNLVQTIDPKGQINVFHYDAGNRLTEVDYADGTQVSYTYDANGNRLTMTGPGAAGTTTFTYDALDRLVSSTDDYGKTVDYGYDPAGNRASLTYPDGKQVTYDYDTASRLTAITDWSSRQTTFSYDGRRQTGMTYPNGTTLANGYDTVGRLTSRQYRKPDSSILFGFQWTRDASGNPVAASEQGLLTPQITSDAVQYSYDNDNRLTNSTAGDYGYDANGNVITQSVGGVDASFAYNPADRLTASVIGTNTVQHVYDGQGFRVARIENGAATNRFVLDRGRSMSHVLCETDGSNNITAYYIHGPQIIGRIGADGSQRYYHTDAIGSVVGLTDDAGNLTDRYAYTPYGELAGSEGNSPNPFTFVGGRGVMREPNGLYFMRARFYQSATGRFLSKDQVLGDPALPMSLHRYAYVGNSPFLFVDSTGSVMTRSEVPGDPMLTEALLQQQTQEAKQSASRFLFGTSDTEFFDPAALTCFLNAKYGTTQTGCDAGLVQQGSRLWEKMHPQMNPDWVTILNAFRYIGEGALCLGGAVGTSGFAAAAACAPLVNHAGTDLAHVGCDTLAGGDKGCHSAVDWTSLVISFVTFDSSGASSGVAKVGQYGALAAKTVGTTGKLAQNYGATGGVVNGTIWWANMEQTLGTYMRLWPQ